MSPNFQRAEKWEKAARLPDESKQKHDRGAEQSHRRVSSGISVRAEVERLQKLQGGQAEFEPRREKVTEDVGKKPSPGLERVQSEDKTVDMRGLHDDNSDELQGVGDVPEDKSSNIKGAESLDGRVSEGFSDERQDHIEKYGDDEGVSFQQRPDEDHHQRVKQVYSRL